MGEENRLSAGIKCKMQEVILEVIALELSYARINLKPRKFASNLESFVSSKALTFENLFRITEDVGVLRILGPILIYFNHILAKVFRYIMLWIK